MAVSFPSFSWRLWGGNKEREPSSKGSSSSDIVKFPAKNGSNLRKGKWEYSEEKTIERDCDAVWVSSDDLHLSEYESDGPDWSIGWEEPHAPGFHGDDEIDGGFAVLVPCYKTGCKEFMEGPNNQLLSAIKTLPNGVYTEGNNYLQQWFSSLKNF